MIDTYKELERYGNSDSLSRVSLRRMLEMNIDIRVIQIKLDMCQVITPDTAKFLQTIPKT